jgi:hypothetical protein
VYSNAVLVIFDLHHQAKNQEEWRNALAGGEAALAEHCLDHVQCIHLLANTSNERTIVGYFRKGKGKGEGKGKGKGGEGA